MLLPTSLVLLLLSASALADKTQDVSEAAAGTAKADEESLLKASKDSLELLAFAKEYITANKLEAVHNEDVVGLMANATDVTNSPDYKSQLGEALSTVNTLSTLISSCEPATAINVHWSEFVQTGATKDITDNLALATKNFNCSTFELEFQTAEAIQGLKDIFSKPYCDINWNYFNKIRLMVHHDPGTVVDFLLDLVKDTNLLPESSVPIVTMMSETMLDNGVIASVGVWCVNAFETALRSEAGQRFYSLLPTMLESDPDKLVALLSNEATYNQATFFNSMENSDFAKGLLRGVAQTLIAGYNLAQELMYDPMKLAMVNGVLVSRDFPPMRKNDLLGSLMGIADKAATYVTTTSEGATLRLEAKAFADEFESKYFRLSKIDELSLLELENVLVQFLMDNGLVAMQEAWLASASMSTHGAECGAFLVCRMNERAIAKGSVIQGYATKLLSMFFSLTWSTYHKDLSYQTLIDATYKDPKSAESCVERFPNTPMYCDIFAQLDKKNEMDLSYEHTEL